MPTRRIAKCKDLDPSKPWTIDNGCVHPEHNPPSMQVFEPGVYEHECPLCGNKKFFRVQAIYGGMGVRNG